MVEENNRPSGDGEFLQELVRAWAPESGTQPRKTVEHGLQDAFDGKMLHPSIDAVDHVVSLGFRYRTKSLKNERVFFVASGGVVRIINEESFIEDEHLYCYEKKGAELASLEERWGVQTAKNFVESDFSSYSKTGNGEEGLVEQLSKVVSRHVGFESDSDSYILAAWIIGTYFHRKFNAYPFLHIKAPKGSGKSQCLTLLSQLCFNATKARPSLAALGDTVDSLRGTYLIDQADSLNRKGGEELLDILADSYKRTGGKRRIVNIEKGHRQTLEFETYSPKAFASIKELPEDLRDRCFVLPLIRSTKSFSDPDDPSNDWREWRGKFYGAFLKRGLFVDIKYLGGRMKYRKNAEIVGRSLELWLPIETILSCFGAADKIDECKKRFFSQYGFAEYVPDELETETVRVLLSMLDDEESIEVTPLDIVSKIDGRLFRTDSNERQRAVAVGWAIKKFNLASEKKRGGTGIRYIFRREIVESIQSSYFDNTLAQPTPPEPDPFTEPDNEMYESNVGDVPTV